MLGQAEGPAVEHPGRPGLSRGQNLRPVAAKAREIAGDPMFKRLYFVGGVRLCSESSWRYGSRFYGRRLPIVLTVFALGFLLRQPFTFESRLRR